MSFPLKAWIDDHASAPHHLSHSGMGGVLRSYDAAIARPEAPDEEALRDEIALMVGVSPARTFLTHGATEANALTLTFLAESARRQGSLRPRFAVLPPEYPPLSDVARWVGLSPGGLDKRFEVAITSNPANPTGLSRSSEQLGALSEGQAQLVVDETFRQFRLRPSLARAGRPRRWVLGSFTKIFGGDDLRIGYVVAPPEMAADFGSFHSMALDDIPDHSVALGRAILRDQVPILREARGVFEANLAHLREQLDDVPKLDAPVHFDRGPSPWDGSALALAALQAGVLVCPGAFFGDPGGVRLCLTQRSFPADLEAYLAVRERWIEGAKATGKKSRLGPRAPRRSRGVPSASG